MAVDLGVAQPGEQLTPQISDTTYLEIIREITAKRNPESLKDSIKNIISSYFSTSKDNLGKLINLGELTNQIFELEGITEINTIRKIGNTTIRVPGISLLIYNPVYPYNDINITTQDLQLPYFKFPFLNNPLDFADKVTVVTPSIQVLQTEF
jgi:hypothetical protein